MMYETEVELLDDEILQALENLRKAFVRNTDFLHVQITMDRIRKDSYNPRIHVVVDVTKSD